MWNSRDKMCLYNNVLFSPQDIMETYSKCPFALSLILLLSRRNIWDINEIPFLISTGAPYVEPSKGKKKSSKENKQETLAPSEQTSTMKRLFGFEKEDVSSWHRLVCLLNRPTDPASLGIFRFLFGEYLHDIWNFTSSIILNCGLGVNVWCFLRYADGAGHHPGARPESPGLQVFRWGTSVPLPPLQLPEAPSHGLDVLCVFCDVPWWVPQKSLYEIQHWLPFIPKCLCFWKYFCTFMFSMFTIYWILDNIKSFFVVVLYLFLSVDI